MHHRPWKSILEWTRNSVNLQNSIMHDYGSIKGFGSEIANMLKYSRLLSMLSYNRRVVQFTFIYCYCALNCCSRMFIVAVPLMAIIPLDGFDFSPTSSYNPQHELCRVNPAPLRSADLAWSPSFSPKAKQSSGITTARQPANSHQSLAGFRANVPPLLGWI